MLVVSNTVWFCSNQDSSGGAPGVTFAGTHKGPAGTLEGRKCGLRSGFLAAQVLALICLAYENSFVGLQEEISALPHPSQVTASHNTASQPKLFQMRSQR